MDSSIGAGQYAVSQTFNLQGRPVVKMTLTGSGVHSLAEL